MLGKHNGVIALLQAMQPVVVPVHSSGHKLELAYKDAIKNTTLAEKVITMLTGLYYLYYVPLNRTNLKNAFRFRIEENVPCMGRWFQVDWSYTSCRQCLNACLLACVQVDFLLDNLNLSSTCPEGQVEKSVLSPSLWSPRNNCFRYYFLTIFNLISLGIKFIFSNNSYWPESLKCLNLAILSTV